MLLEKKETDWSVISEYIFKQSNYKDPIFERIIKSKKMSDEQKKSIIDSYWNYLISHRTNNVYENIQQDITDCPEKIKNIFQKMVDFVNCDNVWDDKQGFLADGLIEKKKEKLKYLIDSVIDYNDGSVRNTGKIHLIKYDKFGLCFCNVPLFGNIYTEFMKNNIKEMFPNTFYGISDKKEFNRRYPHPLHTFSDCLKCRNKINNTGTTYKKYKNEIRELVQQNKET